MWNLSKVDYVLLELVDKQKVIEGITSIDIEADVYYGMFAGLRIETEGTDKVTNVLLQDNENKLHILDLAKYNVLSIEKQSNDTRNCLYMRAHDEDQKAAFDLLHEIVEEFTNQNRMVDKSLTINTDSYSNLPEVFTSKKTNKSVANQPPYNAAANHCGAHSGAHNRRVNSSVGTVHTPAPKPEPTFFRRATKKPSEEDLTNLKNMVILIAQGQYEEQVFPAIKGDDEDSSDYDDDEYDSMMGAGAFC